MKKRLRRVAPLTISFVALLALALPAWALNDQRFTSPRIYDATDGTSEVVTADFDGDGDLDLVAANRDENDIVQDEEGFEDGDVVFIPNNGNGTFGGTAFYDSARNDTILLADAVTDIIAADLNGDGNMDLAMTDTGPKDTGEGAVADGRLVTMLGDGSGNFRRIDNEVMTGSVNPVELVAGDFDGEGDLEIAVANEGDGTTGGTVTILRNSGAANFTEDTTMLDPTAGTESVISIDVGNFNTNTDNEPDLVVALDDGVSNTPDSVFIYTGVTGPENRNFDPATQQTVAVGDAPRHVLAADFNDDGTSDIATANNGSDNVSVAVGNGNATFDAAEPFATQDGPYSLTTADFNLDDKQDLAVANSFGVDSVATDPTSSNTDEGTVSVLQGNNDGTFDTQRAHKTGDSPVGITAGRFNGDGLTDIATANFGTDGPDNEDGSVAVLFSRFQCNDQADNDDDKNIDAPADLGCDSITDNTESPDPATYNIANAPSINEGNSGTTDAVFKVTRVLDGSDDRRTTVNYTTGDGTATQPGDYVQTQGTLTFEPGQTEKEIRVPVNGDIQFENDETFKVTLSSPSSGSKISDDEGTGTILNDDQPQCNDTQDNDNDGKTDYDGGNGDPGCENAQDNTESPDPPVLSVGDSSATEGDSGSTNITFTVTRSGILTGSSTVSYATSEGTATEPEDYTQTAGSLTFAPGDATEQFSVPVKGDVAFESDETFKVTLSGPTGATVGDAEGTGTIVENDVETQCNDGADNDNDGKTDFGGANPDSGCSSASDDTENPDAPTVSIDDASFAEGNSGSRFANFTVTRSANNTSEPSTVRFATSDGTATQPGDYALTTGTVTFAAGETEQQARVSVKGDTEVEPDETFDVTLSNPTNATIADGTATGTIQNDDQPQCSDGIDNDSDGKTDFGGTNGDPGCSSADDAAENPNPPGIRVSDVSETEGDAGTKNFVFNVTRSGDASGASTVDYATSNGTATAGADYEVASGTINFAAGDASETITINVNGDTDREPDETFNVDLSNANGGVIDDARGVGTIENDEPPLPQCGDGIDNDSDGKTDFGGANGDLGCESATDSTESPNPPECNDGVDNDSDGRTDYDGGNGDLGCTSATDSTESPDPPSADLELDLKASSDRVKVGRKLTYTITITNNSQTNDAQNVDIMNTIPSGVSYLAGASSTQCEPNGRDIVCQFGDVAAGQTETREVVVRVNRDGRLTDTAKIFRNSTADPDSNNDSDTVTTRAVN